MTAPSTELTAFHTILSRLAAAGIHCTIESDGKTAGETWAAYHFADTSHVTWGAYSDTGAENSATHPVTSHGYLNAFHTTDEADEYHLFDTGDFDRDAAELTTWITKLAADHGRTRQ
ncbi:hypothetical protein AR457_38260 [Streptomyces agglomeratus]|uniref:hypothetical protein n=1 Tax=Streptomyces agglomeratus TaxID=285458 RepID=UPI00085490B5|nr:hypothetical protein [Streptomyces agglomeratus]OEJ23043.1 hypothetical protein AR457_38260 [Streptomyces agglomeratus]